MTKIKELWYRPCGYAQVLHLAFPLVLSTGSWSIQHFVDRMFLSWYSSNALAASMPAGMLSFSLVSFFLGTAGYVNTFVAQYYGARQFDKIGAAIWQALYFVLLSGIVFISMIPCASVIFAWAGHSPKIQLLEIEYFRILSVGAVFIVYASVLSSFFTGRGKTWTVMWVNIFATAINLILDYAFIFGHWGFPEWGMAGAAWATVISAFVSATLFSLLYFLPKKYRDTYSTVKNWRLQKFLFWRLMCYGIPSGIQFMLEMTAFTLFIFMIGRMGNIELAASTMSFQINTLAFLPMIGFGIATSTLVGQQVGEKKPKIAMRATWSAFHLTFAYMSVISLCYLFFPSLFIEPYAMNAEPLIFAKIRPMAVVLLRFIAAYSLFDAASIIFSSCLKGAGDTRFVMLYSLTLSWCVMVIPTWYVVKHQIGGLFLPWMFMLIYIFLVGCGFFLRFLQGKWLTMQVIE